MWNIILAILGILIVICLWIILYEDTHFVIRNYSCSDARIRKRCRMVVLADLHNHRYGRHNEILLEAIRGEHPDLILTAGDMITASKGARMDAALELLGHLAAEYPLYFANGNHEQRIKLYPEEYGDMAQRLADGLERAGIKPLINEHRDLEVYGIRIYGTELDRFYYKRFHVQHMAPEYLTGELGEPSETLYNVMIAHNPDYFPQYAQWGADLVLSGHVHGGVVAIPFWHKGIVSPNIRLFPHYDGGRFDENGSTMLLSRGLGMHTLPVRLFDPAELLVVDLVPEKEEN